MKLTREQVYSAIDSERDYQESKVEKDSAHQNHEVEAFVLYMQCYLTKTIQVLGTEWGPEAKVRALDEIRKIAGLAVACMEQHGVNARAK